MPSIVQKGYTPLHAAVNENNEEICKFLLAAGADVNKAEKMVRLRK